MGVLAEWLHMCLFLPFGSYESTKAICLQFSFEDASAYSYVHEDQAAGGF
jgi:hypothetical protein